jgi:hypothetical protein
MILLITAAVITTGEASEAVHKGGAQKVAANQLCLTASTAGVISHHAVSPGKHVSKCAPRNQQEVANNLSNMLLKFCVLNNFDQTKQEAPTCLCEGLIL